MEGKEFFPSLKAFERAIDHHFNINILIYNIEKRSVQFHS